GWKWMRQWKSTGGFGGLSVHSPKGTYWVSNQYQLNDDVSMVRGAHQINIGGQAAQVRVVELASFLTGGSFVFNGSVTGLGMGDYMTGRVTTFQQGKPNKADIHETRLNVYAADSWKVSSRLTANYGIRWEPFLPQV